MRLIKLAFAVLFTPLLLTACGGVEEDAPATPKSSYAAPDATARAISLALQTNLWTSGCQNQTVTTLEFDAQRLTTVIERYEDPQCLMIRKDFRYQTIENYFVLNDVVDASGVDATRIDFTTKLSTRRELMYLENGVLYLGVRQTSSNYTATAIDFRAPYLRLVRFL